MIAITPLNHTVPISDFNRGKAGKIFSDVKTSGLTVVMKNNAPECVLLSPDDYSKLIERLENFIDICIPQCRAFSKSLKCFSFRKEHSFIFTHSSQFVIHIN